MTDDDQTSEIADGAVPVGLMIGPERRSFVEAICAALGYGLHTESVSQVRYIPERSLTVQYRAVVTGGGGGRTRITLVGSWGRKMPKGVPALTPGGFEVSF